MNTKWPLSACILVRFLAAGLWAQDTAFEPQGEQIPQPNDWLANHAEVGQTFDQFTRSLPNRPDNRRCKLSLQFDVVERYRRHLDFHRRAGFEDESQRLDKRLRFIALPKGGRHTR